MTVYRSKTYEFKEENEVSEESTALFGSEIDASLDLCTLKGLYAGEPWVYIACSEVANKVAKIGRAHV